MGAQVVKSVKSKCTHVVWSEGKPSTLWAAASKEDIVIVTPSWINKCAKDKTLIDPKPFLPIDFESII